MRAGLMRHRVTLQTNTPVEEASGGGYTDSWADTATLWANVQPAPAAGVEGVIAGAERVPLTHTVTTRYRSGITAKHRLKYGTRYLYVTGIQNVGERNREIVLACEERP